MKNDKMVSAYLSTTQAAHRLGLSVGTVQRMVESGILQAYTTQGGHRRILTTSLNHYCRGALETTTGHPHVCVLSSSAHVTAELDALNLLDGLQVITNPLELAGIHDKVGVLFLDARIPWLPWADLHLADSLGTEAHCIIYNSAHLPDNCQTALQAQATLYPGDVSADLVQGYLLGHALVNRNALPPPPALGVGAETATDLLIKQH
jgi:excisionase family DNA binding protein